MMNTILIIDDDIQIGNLLEEVLTRANYHVLRAYSGTEALLVLNRERPDLILLDLMLSGLSGEKVLPRIKGIPVIVVSEKVDVQDKINLLLGGAVDYMTKPFDTGELLARIQVQLRRAAEGPLPQVYTHGDLSLDKTARLVTAAGKYPPAVPGSRRSVRRRNRAAVTAG